MTQLPLKLACLTIVSLGVNSLLTQDEQIVYMKKGWLRLDNYCGSYNHGGACVQTWGEVNDSSTVADVCRTSKLYAWCQKENCSQAQSYIDSLTSDIQFSMAYNLSADMNTIIFQAAEMQRACDPSYNNYCRNEDGAVSNAKDTDITCLAIKVFTSCVERNCADKDLNYDKIARVKNNPTCNHTATIASSALLCLLMIATRYAM